MKKLILLVAVLGALWTVPATRSRMVLIAQPLLVKLGPVGERIVNPARRYAARTEATMLLRILAERINENKPIPDARSFPRWVQQQLKDDAPDPWGNEYWFEQKRGTLTVGSSGEDGRRGTADDVAQTVPY